MLKTFITIASILVVSAFAQSENSDSSNNVEAKVKVKKTQANKTDKADELITNKRLRAQNGSLSPLSMNASISYSGGSLERPFAADRPNIVASGSAALISGLSSTLSGSYRLTKVDRIGAGIGLQVMAPFNSSIKTTSARTRQEFDNNQGELDVSNPFISYTRLAKFYGVQTVLSTSLTKYTAGNLRDAGWDYGIDASFNTMYDFNGGPFSIGLLGVFTKNFFDNDDPSLRAGQNDIVFGFLPQAELNINDTFNIRTIVRSHWFQNDRLGTKGKFSKRPVTQSIGVGISINRNVFLYPNVQFAYDNFSAENTNVGLTANINLF